MENNELLRRAEDLRARCEKSGDVTATGFLSPAERCAVECWAKHIPDCAVRFSGGGEDCERTAAFFLPYYMDGEDFDPAERIRAIKLTAHFGEPGHRDYMGALLGMGIGREWLGDIAVHGDTAYIFCLPSVEKLLLGIDKVGRFSVSAESVPLASVPAAEKQTSSVSFSVMSLRLDAVTAGMFKLSRTESVRQINAGNLSLNYRECVKTDATVREGDVISVRGLGKGTITGTGGVSRKGRLFVYADICI